MNRIFNLTAERGISAAFLLVALHPATADCPGDGCEGTNFPTHAPTTKEEKVVKSDTRLDTHMETQMPREKQIADKPPHTIITIPQK